MFSDNLNQGKAGESAIARWLTRKGYAVLPVYEKIIEEGKGPQLYLCDKSLIAPDLFVFAKRQLFIEVKHKSAFTWYRIKQVFETGIDKRHWNDYLQVRDIVGVPIWILFLHKHGKAKNSPPCQGGLYGADIDLLRKTISHEDDRWGRSGMVYWTREEDGGPLKKLANYEDLAQFD